MACAIPWRPGIGWAGAGSMVLRVVASLLRGARTGTVEGEASLADCLGNGIKLRALSSARMIVATGP